MVEIATHDVLFRKISNSVISFITKIAILNINAITIRSQKRFDIIEIPTVVSITKNLLFIFHIYNNENIFKICSELIVIFVNKIIFVSNKMTLFVLCRSPHNKCFASIVYVSIDNLNINEG